MLACPYCGAEFIEGSDHCDECSQTLSEVHIRVPSSSVEVDLLRDRIEILPPRKPICVSPETNVGDVLQQMVQSRIGCVLVVEAGRLVGIFTERDALLKLGTDAAKLADRPVKTFMTTHPETLDAQAKIAYALHKMDMRGYRHLPILDAGRPIGVISIRDILAYLTSRVQATG